MCAIKSHIVVEFKFIPTMRTKTYVQLNCNKLQSDIKSNFKLFEYFEYNLMVSNKPDFRKTCWNCWGIFYIRFFIVFLFLNIYILFCGPLFWLVLKKKCLSLERIPNLLEYRMKSIEHCLQFIRLQSTSFKYFLFYVVFVDLKKISYHLCN